MVLCPLRSQPCTVLWKCDGVDRGLCGTDLGGRWGSCDGDKKLKRKE